MSQEWSDNPLREGTWGISDGGQMNRYQEQRRIEEQELALMARQHRDDSVMESAGMAMAPAVYQHGGESPLGRGLEPVFTFGPIGSRQATLYYSPKCGGIVSTGCFTGTLDEFAADVSREHGESQHGIAYNALITFLRTLPRGYYEIPRVPLS